MSCYQVLNALRDCQNKHPRDVDIFCRHLTTSAGWCIFQSVCPREVQALEDCVGTTNIRTIGDNIPNRCADREAALSACIEGQRLAAEDRTATCPSKQAKLP
ncbi:hypothetical protein CEUSTIGMA_g3621.t1 [Chlamydomonas eustigma]|uniref:IMS import disulfide relay-system CHCH-CHCH-like Cx9C domain-containing protein n=1 Tax=Chlamydomonas eustigma TaxID=1157962 RepID=A0A250WZB0_9CHLO|nr:hypothetical protein CEUSTIGMA_g3621.t1 [Chlamydomonas eustigma]|eukprot:GAX76177.1 hypothetical protein CEUSTIGMA_g3621.t1 [Chlamydomonas eustigma]